MRKIVAAYVREKALANITPDDAKRLTQINISFALVSDDAVQTNHLVNMDRLAGIRAMNPDIRILLSVGGWGAGGFSEAASTDAGRERFSRTAAQAVDTFGLDGIDIDWEYPTIGVAGIACSPDDRDNFTLLLQSLRSALNRCAGGWKMLTIATGADQYFIDGTHMDEAQRYLDLVQIMTYDMRGGFQNLTGHHTNLYASSGDLFRISADAAVKLFEKAGVPREKIVIGAAFYARKWTGVPNANNGLYQMAASCGGHGEHFANLRDRFINQNGYVRYWDEEACAPWLFNGDTFYSYDDEQSIGCKCRYIKEHNLAGIMYWEYSCDPTGTLLRAMQEGLNP